MLGSSITPAHGQSAETVAGPEPLTLVCFALPDEAAPFRRAAGNQTGIEILVTGMGKRNSEQAVRQALSRFRPAAVLTCGYAGGLNPELKPGQVVFCCDESSGLGERLRTAGAREARFHCAERIAVTASAKKTLWEATGADVVDMESEVIRQVCQREGIPSATVRAISDSAEDDLPLDFNLLLTSD